MSDRIPKRIIQTGKHATRLSLRERAIRANLTSLNPDYEYLFFDDDEVRAFLRSEFPQFVEVFDGFRFPIQKYDFFRYLAIYHQGGFYFDLDVLLARGLSGLSQYSCVFPFEGLTFSPYLRVTHGMDWQLGNYAFASIARHPLLGAIIENCVRSHKDPEYVRPLMRGMPRFSREQFWVMNTTGPGLISRTVAERPDLATEIKILFPPDVCSPAGWNLFGDYGIHLMEGSWRPQSGYVGRRLAQLWEVWRMRRLIQESRERGATRTLPASTRSDEDRRRTR